MQQQYILVGSQGSFPVPSGESRIGSDAACQICIRGDGVLPVHAYLRADGEKVLIRPAEGGSPSAGYSGAAVTVNGKSLEGPASLTGGQEVLIGGVQMRLLANGVKEPGIWSKKWFRVTCYSVGGFAAFLLLSYLFLTYVLLDQGRMNERMSKELAAVLNRDEIEIDSVNVQLFSGKVDVTGLRIKDRHSFAGTDPFIEVTRAGISMDVWSLMGLVTPLPRSWFGEYNNVRITLTSPKVNIVRARGDGAFNIDDILQHMQAGPIQLDAEKLDFTIDITGGKITLTDQYTNIGSTALENINVLLHQPAAGSPLEIQKCDMRVNSNPAPLQLGMLNLSGGLNLIDDTCRIDTSTLSAENLQVQMTSFDLARIFEHAGYAWKPYGLNFKVVLGKPLTGQMDVQIVNPKDLRVRGNLKTDSLLSIREENSIPVGNIPTKLDFSAELIDSGNGYRPHDLNLSLRSGKNIDDPQTTHLAFKALGSLHPAGNSTYTVTLDCKLHEFLDTDIGKRLGLQGRLGGRLQGAANLIVDRQKQANINVKLRSDDYYVMIPDPESSEPIAARKLVPQPIPLVFDCQAGAFQGNSGGLSHIDIKSFTLAAPPSFVATTGELPGYIKGVDTGQLDAMAKFQLNLKGKEFWTNFAPVLALFGFTHAVEENMNLVVTVAGKDGTLSIGTQGTASRQWGPDKSPVELLSVLDYNANAADPATNPNSVPYLSLDLQFASAEGKPLKVRLQANCSRDKAAETLTLETYGIDPKTPGINSDIETLRERFQPYIERTLQSWDESAQRGENGWLPLYQKTELQGQLEQSGRVVIRQMINRENPLPDTVTFDLNIAGRELKAATPFTRSDDKEPGLWKWQEKDFKVAFKGDYSHRVSLNKEEPSREVLNVEKLDVNGRLGGFLLTARELDLFRLANIYNLPNQAWPDVLKGLTISGDITPAFFDFVRSVRLLPVDHPASGKLALKIDYDQKKDSLNLEKFVFQQTDKDREFFLTALDVNGSLLAVRDLSSRLMPARANAPSLSESLSYWLHESGPVAMLDHLGDTLSINSLQLETVPLVQWLSKDFKAQTGREAPPIIAGLIRKDWQPEGTWRAVGVRFTRDDPRIRRWTLVGDLLRNDFTCYSQPNTPGGERTPYFSFSHEWQLLMGLALSQDNSIALNANLNLDHSYIWASLARFKTEDYKKKAKEPCKIQLVCDAHGNLAQIGSLKLTGGPIELDMSDLKIDAGAGGQGSYAIGQLAIAGGPLPSVITVNKYEPGADMLNLRIIAPNADLAYIARLHDIAPAGIDVHGRLKDLDARYRGSIVALDSMFETDFENLKTRYPKIDAADVRFKGLNPETDMLEADAKLVNVSLANRISTDDTQVKLGGQIKLTTRDLSWTDMQTEITIKSGEHVQTHAFNIPKLHVNSLDAKLNILRAARTRGLPLDVNADITFKTPFDLATVLNTQQLLLAKLSASPPPVEGIVPQINLTPMEKFSFTGGLKVPAMINGDRQFAAVAIPAFTLKNLKLSIPALATELHGGKVMLADTVLDLSKANLTQVDGKWAVKNIVHEQRLELADADLASLLGAAKESGAFTVLGRVDAQKGVLKGTDYAPDWRHTWDGAIKLKLSDLSFQSPTRGKSVQSKDAPAWLAPYSGWGVEHITAMSKAAGSETINVREWSDSLATAAGQKRINGMLLGVQIYLSKAFGVELDKLEFQPISPTIVVSKGFAAIEPFQLIGRGSCEGLDLQVRNLKINLSTESFADDAGEGVLIYPLAIPKAAREKMLLSRWAPALRDEYLKSMEQGKLPLRVYGQLAAPVMKYPWAELRGIARRVLFDSDHLIDLESLDKARLHFQRTWGNHGDIEIAAAFADRTGVGLPGTATARDQGSDIIERVPGLPQSLTSLRARSAKDPASPKDSLEMLLRPEPDAIVPPVTPNPPGAREKK
jgi:hypothetical protein